MERKNERVRERVRQRGSEGEREKKNRQGGKN